VLSSGSKTMSRKASASNPTVNRAVPLEGSASSIGKTIWFDPTREWTESTIQLYLCSSASWQQRSHALWWIWFNAKAPTWLHQKTPYAIENDLVGKPYKGFEEFCQYGQEESLTAPTGYRHLKIACSPRYKDLYVLDLDTRYVIQLAKLQGPQYDELFNYLTWSVRLGIRPLALQPILELTNQSLKQAVHAARTAYFEQREKMTKSLESLPY
jgi:hypothetical protein